MTRLFVFAAVIFLSLVSSADAYRWIEVDESKGGWDKGCYVLLCRPGDTIESESADIGVCPTDKGQTCFYGMWGYVVTKCERLSPKQYVTKNGEKFVRKYCR